MKNLKELDISLDAKLVVRKWLIKWRELFERQAGFEKGNVYRADFEKEDFFYFTDCRDILAKDPECKSKETNPLIIKRKLAIRMQLFMTTLLGDAIGKKILCTHCGYDDLTINATVNGHYTFCPKCEKISLTGYFGTLKDSTIDTLKQVERELRNVVKEDTKKDTPKK